MNMEESSQSTSSGRGDFSISRHLNSLSLSSHRGTVEGRKSLALLVRVLLQYLGRVDLPLMETAKETLRDCERKHKTRDSKFGSLADAIYERVRNAVGERHWAQALRIHTQLLSNLSSQQKKKPAEVIDWREKSSDPPAAQKQQTQAGRKQSPTPMNAEVLVSRRVKVRSLKRSASSSSPESSYSSACSSLTTSGNEKSGNTESTSSTAPSTTSNPSSSSGDARQHDTRRYSNPPASNKRRKQNPKTDPVGIESG